jgi:energy-coupling factor transporter transmembrane protein EcfT
MTPNGAVVFAIVIVAGATLSGRIAGLIVLLALCVIFGAIEIKARLLRAFAWPAAIVAPLALFMAIVWIGVVGRAPAEIAAGAPGTREAAFWHVATICTRLFVIAFVMRLVALRFPHLTPMQFIDRLRLPVVLKKLIILTLSWIDTILHAVDRSRTALVTAGVIAPRLSVRNVANGWVLVQTVWLSVITIAIGRARDKWPAENTLARLEAALQAPAQGLCLQDGAWIAAAAAFVLIAMAA